MKNHYVDSGMFVCVDELIFDIKNNKSVTFSFNIINGWTFDLICIVYEFDLSVNFPSKREWNTTFEKLGVSDKNCKVNLMETLGKILRKHHYSNRKNIMSKNWHWKLWTDWTAKLVICRCFKTWSSDCRRCPSNGEQSQLLLFQKQ